MLEIFLFLSIAGFASGLIAGFFGIGGGILIVPALFFIFQYYQLDYPLLLAVATSLMIVAPTLALSSFVHHRKESIEWGCVKRYSAFIIIGTWFGSLIALHAPQKLFMLFYSCYLSLIGLYYLTGGKYKPSFKVPFYSLRFALDRFFLIFVGAVATLFGVGGGLFMVPFLHFKKLNLKMAIGTSSVFGIFISLFGAINYMHVGSFFLGKEQIWHNIGPVSFTAFAMTLPTSLIGAFIGSHLVHRTKSGKLKIMLGILLLIMAIKVFLTI